MLSGREPPLVFSGQDSRISAREIGPVLLCLPTVFKLRMMSLYFMKEASLVIRRTQDTNSPAPGSSV